MTTEENKAFARRFFQEMDRRKAVPEEMCDPALTLNLAGNPPLDLQGIKGMVGMFYAAFPDLTHTIEQLVAEGDKVAIRATIRGTHKGDFMGIPSTGRQVTVILLENMRISGGKAAEGHGVLDQLGLMQQLGVIPTPSQAPAATGR